MSSKIIPKERREEGKEKNLVEIYNYMGWTFVLLIILDFLVILIRNFTDYNLALLFLFFIMAAMCFGVSALVKSNPIDKKGPFRGFIISSALIGIITIFVVSVYQW